MIDESFGEATSAADVTYTGKIDLSCIESFRSAIHEAEVRGRDLVIDLNGATFIDSTGIAALVAAASRARDGGSSVRVRATDPTMRRVFEIMELDAMLEFEPPLTRVMHDVFTEADGNIHTWSCATCDDGASGLTRRDAIQAAARHKQSAR